MLVVKVYLRPGIMGNDPSHDEQIGEIQVGRREKLADIKGNIANYNVRFFSSDKGKKYNPDRVWKKAEVAGFHRVRFGKWDLIYLALHAIVGARHMNRRSLRPNTRQAKLLRKIA